ncbi:MAG: VanW family protein [Bacillota bacterium]|jgi:vancomycin resistance protein YoaR
MKKYYRILMALALIVAAVLPGYLLIWPGTRVCGIGLGGLSMRQAVYALEEAFSWDTRQIEIVGADGDSEQFPLKSTGITPDIEGTVMALRRPLWLILRKEYPLLVYDDEEQKSAWFNELAGRFNQTPMNASFKVTEDDRVEVTGSRLGVLVNLDELEVSLFNTGKWFDIISRIELPLIYVKPEITTEQLEDHLPLEVASSYSTYYQDKNDRAHNIALAGSVFNGFIIDPGQVLSFNDTTGPRSKERGYRKAGVFIGTSVVDDYGGGVCQVSTTLYVALLKAGFEIVERYNHGMPVSYVPLGMDATVAFDILDLKMKNSTDVPCILKIQAQDGCLTVKVFGKKDPDMVIEIEPKVVKEIPAQPLDSGGGFGGDGIENTPKLRSGFMVETSRKYIRGGRVVKAEKLNSSWYPPEKPKPSPAAKAKVD